MVSHALSIIFGDTDNEILVGSTFTDIGGTNIYRGLVSLDAAGATSWVDLGLVNDWHDLVHLTYANNVIITAADRAIAGGEGKVLITRYDRGAN